MNDIKVYQMNEYDWVATPFDLEKTIQWYMDEVGMLEEEIQDVRECDIEKEGTWCEVTGIIDMEQIKEKQAIGDKKFGDMKKQFGTVWIYTSFKDAIINDIKEPYIISSTEI